jgi:hypothetical protein
MAPSSPALSRATSGTSPAIIHADEPGGLEDLDSPAPCPATELPPKSKTSTVDAEKVPFWLDFLTPVLAGSVFLAVVWIIALAVLFR